ncbi:TPA: alpha/beta hydrolase [Streptococcus pyogenes]|nr:alpha/beta hydrolase [Streptococcus pyogenes]
MRANYNLNIVGNTDMKKVLLIHGVGFNYKNCFNEIINKLKKNYCVLSPELPGHGSETIGILNSVEDVAKDIEESLLSEGINHIACVYGISLGASIAVQIALNGQIKIDKLIIDGGQYESMGEMIEQFSSVMSEQFINLKNGIHLIEAVREGMGYGDNDITVLTPMMYSKIEKTTLYEAFKMAYSYDIKNKKERFTMPICIMFGSRETYASKYIELIKSKSLDSVEILSFANAGHAEILGTNPDLILNEIEKSL